MDQNYVREFNMANGRLPDGGQKTDRNIVEFFKHSIQDDEASAQSGRPVYRDVTMVRIAQPGDKNLVVERKARDADKVRFSRQWSAFERSEEMAADGWPLEHWTLLDRSKARELKYFNIMTVEHLAGLTDDQMSQIGMLGLRTLVRQARAALEHAKTGQIPAAIVAENEKQKNEIAILRKQIEDMGLRFESELRKVGVNPSASDAANAAVMANAPRELSPVTPTLTIPDDFSKMSGKEVIEMARTVTGVSFRTRNEAELALRDAKDGK